MSTPEFVVMFVATAPGNTTVTCTFVPAALGVEALGQQLDRRLEAP